jgi:hypothetical protein
VVVEILGVIKLVPVPNEVPPVEAAYQFRVPAEALALRVNVPAPFLDLGVVLIIYGHIDNPIKSIICIS